jgi:hypothetical protein
MIKTDKFDKTQPIITESIYAESAKPAPASPSGGKPPARTALLASLLLAGIALVAFPVNSPSPSGQIAGLKSATPAAREAPKSELTGSIEKKPRKVTHKLPRRTAQHPPEEAWAQRSLAADRYLP